MKVYKIETHPIKTVTGRVVFAFSVWQDSIMIAYSNVGRYATEQDAIMAGNKQIKIEERF